MLSYLILMKDNLIIAKFKKQLMKSGKLFIATKILNDTLAEVASRGPAPPKNLVGAINNTKPLVILKQVRVRGNMFTVPFPQTPSQQINSSINLLIKSARTQKIPLRKALANELISSFQGRSLTVKEVEKLHSIAVKNKVFSTYRWF